MLLDSRAVASKIREAWKPPSGPSAELAHPETALPNPAVLERLLEMSFQASLLREENRPLTFRLILRGAERFPASAGPPEGLHRLVFERPRPFTPSELRRLTPAVDFDRSLVGVHLHDTEQLQIWGMVQSGARWLEQFHGGRGNVFELPDSLIIGVSAPGYMTISQGARPICTIEAGNLEANRLNVFNSQWLRDSFASIREELRQLHLAERASSDRHWATVEADLTRIVARQMIQRLISTVQRSWHGGTLLIVPAENSEQFCQTSNWVNLKYSFRSEEPRERFRTLMVGVMRRLAIVGADGPNKSTVGWDDYGRIRDGELTNLDEAIFEMAHMIATLTQVDGAVVVTKRFELLGFGGEIVGTLPEVQEVAHALDLEGDTYGLEATEGVGTRHRSVYRLCSACPDVLGIVVSQDGGTRFVRKKDSQVMYWRHTTISSYAMLSSTE